MTLCVSQNFLSWEIKIWEIIRLLKISNFYRMERKDMHIANSIIFLAKETCWKYLKIQLTITYKYLIRIIRLVNCQNFLQTNITANPHLKLALSYPVFQITNSFRKYLKIIISISSEITFKRKSPNPALSSEIKSPVTIKYIAFKYKWKNKKWVLKIRLSMIKSTALSATN